MMGAVVLAAGLLSATSATAVHGDSTLDGSTFEIDTDANLKRDHAVPSEDWASVEEIRKQDSPSGKADESFGQGTKEDTAEPIVVKGSIPPNKSDLRYFGVYQEGSGGSGFLNLYWSRVQEPVGTTNMDFEFNARQCTPGQTPADPDCTPNGLTPYRTVGDLLIAYDLAQGGTNPILSLREWTGSVWGPAADLTGSAKATGSINTTPIPAGESDGLGAHSARTFGETQIDLSAVFDTADCQSFGSAYLKSRASDSFPAALKDFVPPAAVNITNCGSLQINKTDDQTPGVPLAGAGFTLYQDLAPAGGTRGGEDTITTMTCTTAAEGVCTLSNVFFGSYWLVETTVPTGYSAAADKLVSVPDTTVVEVDLVDPRIILQPTITTAQSFRPNDSATVQVATGQGDLAGSVRFELYDNATCSGTALYSEAVAVDGTGLGQTVSTTNTTYLVTTDTELSWKVTYTSTNAGHTNVSSICDDEHSDVTIDNNHLAD